MMSSTVRHAEDSQDAFVRVGKSSDAVSYRCDTRIDFHVGLDPAITVPALALDDERRRLTWEAGTTFA